LKKNVILSIKPEFVAEIKAGRKCFEFRKTIFKEKVEKVYIYASSPISKVVGEFQPVDILSGPPAVIWKQTQKEAGITKAFYDTYFNGKPVAYAIVIQNLKIYDIPKELPFHAPQSFRYIDSL
jgi:predicted transcriptional regulator